MFVGDWRDRALYGAKFGALMATIYSLYVIGLYAFRGSAPFEALGVSLTGTIAAYYAGGIVAGGTAGVLWPVTRRRIGAIVVAAVCSFLVYGGVIWIMEGPIWRWTTREWSAAMILGFIMGVVLGNFLYKRSAPIVAAPGTSSLRTVNPPNTSPQREV